MENLPESVSPRNLLELEKLSCEEESVALDENLQNQNLPASPPELDDDKKKKEIPSVTINAEKVENYEEKAEEQVVEVSHIVNPEDRIETEDIDNKHISEALSNAGEILQELIVRGEEISLASASSLTLIESPFVTTPPYEYIVLTPENEKKFRLYLNPKLDRKFKASTAAMTKLEVEFPTGISAMTRRSKSGLPLPHLEGAETTVECFDASEVNMELARILKARPPQTHGIVRRKPRAERGSSVPAIDSYYGCKDLDKVGHASYFIPDLTPEEKKAIGWKNTYSYGKWKYGNLRISNPNSGHVPFGALTRSLSIKFKPFSRSRSSSKKKSSQDKVPRSSIFFKSKDKSASDDKKGIEEDVSGVFITTNEATAFIATHKDSSTDIKLLGIDVRINQGSGSQTHRKDKNLSAALVHKRSLQRVRRRLRKWIRDILPCIKSKNSPSPSSDTESVPLETVLSHEDCLSKGSSCCSEASILEGEEEDVMPGRRRFFQVIFNCRRRRRTRKQKRFGCFKSHRRSEVFGGDVLVSNDISSISFEKNKEVFTNEEVEVMNDDEDIPIESAAADDDVDVKPVEVDVEVSPTISPLPPNPFLEGDEKKEVPPIESTATPELLEDAKIINNNVHQIVNSLFVEPLHPPSQVLMNGVTSSSHYPKKLYKSKKCHDHAAKYLHAFHIKAVPPASDTATDGITSSNSMATFGKASMINYYAGDNVDDDEDEDYDEDEEDLFGTGDNKRVVKLPSGVDLVETRFLDPKDFYMDPYRKNSKDQLSSIDTNWSVNDYDVDAEYDIDYEDDDEGYEDGDELNYTFILDDVNVNDDGDDEDMMISDDDDESEGDEYDKYLDDELDTIMHILELYKDKPEDAALSVNIYLDGLISGLDKDMDDNDNNDMDHVNDNEDGDVDNPPVIDDDNNEQDPSLKKSPSTNPNNSSNNNP